MFLKTGPDPSLVCGCKFSYCWISYKLLHVQLRTYDMLNQNVEERQQKAPYMQGKADFSFVIVFHNLDILNELSEQMQFQLAGFAHVQHHLITTLIFILVEADRERGFHLDIEDYLSGVLTLASELVRKIFMHSFGLKLT